MAAVAAQAAAVAAQAAANAANTAVGQQLLLIQQLQAQQQFLLDNADRERSGKPKELTRGVGFYNPWMMKAESYLASKLQDWALALDDAAMLAHPNYPAGAPVFP